jgi:hypothetical protein
VGPVEDQRVEKVDSKFLVLIVRSSNAPLENFDPHSTSPTPCVVDDLARMSPVIFHILSGTLANRGNTLYRLLREIFDFEDGLRSAMEAIATAIGNSLSIRKHNCYECYYYRCLYCDSQGSPTPIHSSIIVELKVKRRYL